jgi:hypothetical protein
VRFATPSLCDFFIHHALPVYQRFRISHFSHSSGDGGSVGSQKIKLLISSGSMILRLSRTPIKNDSEPNTTFYLDLFCSRGQGEIDIAARIRKNLHLVINPTSLAPKPNID